MALSIAAGSAVLAYHLNAGRPWARIATIVLQSVAFVFALRDLGDGRVGTALLFAPAIVGTLLWHHETLAFFGVRRRVTAAI